MTEVNNSNLIAVCFEHIKTINDIEYHRGLYGDFIVIIIKSNDYRNGYINGTKLCQDGGKYLYHWNESKRNKEMIANFNIFNRDQYPVFGYFNIKFNINTGNKTNEDKLISGTYFHPNIIVHLASWINDKFAWKVAEITNNYFNNFNIKEYKDNEDKLNKKIDELTNNIQQIKLEHLNQINTIKPQIVHNTLNPLTNNWILLYRLTETNKFYISRIQPRRFDLTDRRIRKDYGQDIEEIDRWINVPNGIKMINRLKTENLERFQITGNIITLINDSTEDELLEIIDILYEEKNL